jgi:hypothetical protein
MMVRAPVVGGRRRRSIGHRAARCRCDARDCWTRRRPRGDACPHIDAARCWWRGDVRVPPMNTRCIALTSGHLIACHAIACGVLPLKKCGVFRHIRGDPPSSPYTHSSLSLWSLESEYGRSFHVILVGVNWACGILKHNDGSVLELRRQNRGCPRVQTFDIVVLLDCGLCETLAAHVLIYPNVSKRTPAPHTARAGWPAISHRAGQASHGQTQRAHCALPAESRDCQLNQYNYL